MDQSKSSDSDKTKSLNNNFSTNKNSPNRNFQKLIRFMSLSRKKRNQYITDNNKENDIDLIDNHVSGISRSASVTDLTIDSTDVDKDQTRKQHNVFYSLRKSFYNRFSSRQSKILAYSDPVPTSVTTSDDVQTAQSTSRTSQSHYVDNNLDSRLTFDQIDNHNTITSGSSFDDMPVIVNNNENNNFHFRNTNENVLSQQIYASNNRGPTQSTSEVNENYYSASPCDNVMLNARMQLAKYGWYWGPLSRTAAQKCLAGQINGSFLVRDSQTNKYQFTLSFRSSGCTFHSRIDYYMGYWQIESGHFKSVVELIEDTMKKSEDCVFCYVTHTSQVLPPLPVRLTKPINRFYEVMSLQHLCRFVIRQKIDLDNVKNLPLPHVLQDYVKENFYENV